MQTKTFKRGNGETVSYNEMISLISTFIMCDLNSEYEITIGTDSQTNTHTKVVTVLAIHRIGDGGIFFYNSEYIKRINSLKDKIIEETNRSLTNAKDLFDDIQLKLIESNVNLDDLNVHFQIHCDIGHKGKTKALIKEITSWVESMGYECLIKPDSYTASGIANKITK